MSRRLQILLAVVFTLVCATNILLERTVRENLKAIDAQKEELRTVYQQNEQLVRKVSAYEQLGCNKAIIETAPPRVEEAWFKDTATRDTIQFVSTRSDFCSTWPINKSPRHRIAH